LSAHEIGQDFGSKFMPHLGHFPGRPSVMRVVSFITKGRVIRRILNHLPSCLQKPNFLSLSGDPLAS
jgi:hypothetical protein